jgi:hypothetical protein
MSVVVADSIGFFLFTAEAVEWTSQPDLNTAPFDFSVRLTGPFLAAVR